MGFDFEPLIQWLGQHQEWIVMAIALTSFLESLAVIGIVVPGIALLLAAGTAAGSSGTELVWVLGAGFLGAVAGDVLSFYLGYRYHNVIREVPPFSKHPEWIERGEHFFNKYGLMGIVLGRFVGPIRPFMPLVAGFMQMRPLSFVSINVLSALAWSPFYLMPGYLVGASLESEGSLSGSHLLFLLGLILCGWLLAQLLWWVHDHIYRRRDKLRLALVTAAACLALLITTSQLMQLDWFIQLNQRFSLWNLQLRHPWLDDFFIGLTQLGTSHPMQLWGTLVTLAILLQRNYYVAALWVGTLLTGQELMYALKHLLEWPRPQLVAQVPDSWAYPSGHTSMILVFLGTLAIICLPTIPARRQKAILSGLCIVVALVAGSRLYLTVHWLTDIIGGLLLGGMVLALLYSIVLLRPFRTIRPWPLIIATVLAWLVSLGLWVLPHFSQLADHYLPLSHS